MSPVLPLYLLRGFHLYKGPGMAAPVLLTFLGLALCLGAVALLAGGSPGPVDLCSGRKPGLDRTRYRRWAAVLLGAFLCLGLLTRVPAVAGFDRDIAAWLYKSGSPGFTHLVRSVSDAAGRDMLLIWIPPLLVGLWLARCFPSPRLLGAAVLGSFGLEVMFKAMFHRPRPHSPHQWDSFPSGHTLAATILSGVVLLMVLPRCRHAWQRWLVCLTLGLWPVIISGTRVYLGAHYPTDVLGGMLLGSAWICVCASFLAPSAVSTVPPSAPAASPWPVPESAPASG